jgi:L-lactate dehydrogenase complex protein LldG
MSEARDEVLARVRAALGPQARDYEVPRSYRHAVDLAPAELLELFTHRLLDYRAAVHPTAASEVPTAIRTATADCDRVLVPAGLPPPWAPATATVDRDFSPAELDGFDAVVTACAAACAESGTIVLDAGPDQGRRAITLVPDRHICVVRSDQVVATVPELLGRLDPGRPLTFISGPSATSDIELQRVEGVHGPRTLIVILVDSPPIRPPSRRS